MGDTIIGIQFGIANPEDILKRSVVEVITDKTYQGNQPVPGGVFDARFGVIENGKTCPTCKQTNLLCPGHFGHITLARPVYLYQFLEYIQKILQIVCLNCSNPYLPEEELERLEKLFKGVDRFDAVRERTKDYKAKDLKESSACPHCNSPAIKKVDRQETNVAVAPLALEAKTYDDMSDPIPLQPEMVLRCFQRMTDRHIELIGFNPKFSRPDWMVCTVLAVPPLSVRPSVMEDNQRMEDDLTHVLINIVRDNQKLRDRIDKGDSRDIVDKYTGLVQFHVATYVDNDIKGLPPSAQRSGRPMKTLKSRLGAKTGRVRGNLMGKRVDFSARSVITPDPNIDLDELGVPEEIASNLTFPEIVTAYNRDRLMSYIRNGPGKHPGAKSVYLKDDKRTLSLKYVNVDRIDLKEGDVVHRHLIDGDVVLFNRQPSLHKGSMECHRVKVLPYSTFRLNVSATKPYNADFDGDEMNMHVPQSITSATELKYLASVLRQIISPRKNSPIIEIVQDTMTGAFLISDPNISVPEHVGMNLLVRTKKPLSSFKRRNKDFTGPELISSTFPLVNHESGGIVVKNGQLLKGRMNKGAFSSASKGMIHMIYNEFGPERCSQFINEIQNVVTKFNLFQGFSVGASDLLADLETQTFVKETIDKGKREVTELLSSVHSGTFLNNSGRPDGEELENKVSIALNQIVSTVSTRILESLPKDNRIVQMNGDGGSGAKGDKLNISQMVALLGQQMVAGKRVQYTLQDRTLPHFAKYDHGIESRGFVENSFIQGLKPAEFFFHAMGGREGLIDTAVKTSDSGYIQRKLVKNMEDLHVEYDGTVRNVNGSIIQFSYGGDGIDSICVEQQPCDLAMMSMEDVYKNFAASADMYKSVCSEDVSDAPDMVEQILKDRDTLMKNVFRFVKNDILYSPVHLQRITEKYRNSYATKTDLTPKYVVDELTKMMNEAIFVKNRVFHILLRYYLAPKKAILNLRLSKEMFNELLQEIRFKYIKSQVHAGEMVGTLAAQSIGEPTTQLTLNTFHSAGTTKANATQGVPRMGELLSATHNPKNPLNFVYLKENIATSYDTAILMMKEIQKTTLRDLTKSVRIYYDPDPVSSNTAVQEDAEILKSYEKFSVTHGQSCSSPWILRLELDRLKVAALPSMIDMSIIATRIQNNKVLRVFECIPSDINTKDKLIMRITFSPDVMKNALSLRFIEDKLLDTIITGVDGIGRVFPTEVNKELFYDEKVGGYVPVKQHMLTIEGTNLLDIALNTSTDPYKSFSNDIHEIHEIFGIEAARICLYEEFMEVFTREVVNYHHMITLIDSMTAPGFILSADRAGVNKNDEMGVLAKSSFEETAKHLFNAAVSAENDNMRGVSANIMFGQKPPCGTGFVDILVDETKFPEGADEEVSVFDAELQAANLRVDEGEKAEGNIKMEELVMDW